MDETKVARLIKNDAVELDNGNILYILNYYVKGDYCKCSLRVDSKDNWKSRFEALLKLQPADIFHFEDIGLENNLYPIIYSCGTKLTVISAYKLFNLKFSEKKLRKPEDFINEEFYMMGNVTKPYLRKYRNGDYEFDILSLNEIPTEKWFTAEYEKCNGRHKKSRVIM